MSEQASITLWFFQLQKQGVRGGYAAMLQQVIADTVKGLQPSQRPKANTS
jgi:hypothetical protein